MIGRIVFHRNDLLLLLFSFLILFIPIALIEFKVLHYTHGVFMYPFDDTFIHLQMAKNLKEGIWGMNGTFASASSSLLYTVLLMLFRFVSESTVVPFLVNSIAGIAIIWSLNKWLKRHIESYIAQACIILLAVYLTPLPTMIVTGMEHTLQCLFSFVFVFYFSDWLEQSRVKAETRFPVFLYITAALVSTIRYEGLFLIAVACLMLLYYRKISIAFLLGFVAVLPVTLFGIFSIIKGGYFLPNSVLVKSESFDYSGITGFLTHILIDKLTFAKTGLGALATQRWVIILPLLYITFRRYMRPSYVFIIIFLIVATLLQLSLASTGYLYRYEAYLFFCSVIIGSLLFFKYGKEVWNQLQLSGFKLVLGVLVLFLFFPIVLRSTAALGRSVQACKNIYDQQFQMAQFSRSNYFNSTIAANDIGAISYFTNASIVDLWGLATIEVTKSKKGKYWTPAFLDSLSRSRGAKLAMIYDSWFTDSLTSKWKKVASWQIQNNVICGDDTVSFYAVDNSEYLPLYNQLKAYEPRLPSSVVVKYF
jgi:hypothetical protein